MVKSWPADAKLTRVYRDVVWCLYIESPPSFLSEPVLRELSNCHTTKKEREPPTNHEMTAHGVRKPIVLQPTDHPVARPQASPTHPSATKETRSVPSSMDPQNQLRSSCHGESGGWPPENTTRLHTNSDRRQGGLNIMLTSLSIMITALIFWKPPLKKNRGKSSCNQNFLPETRRISPESKSKKPITRCSGTRGSWAGRSSGSPDAWPCAQSPRSQ